MPEFFSQSEFSMACEYGWRAAPPTHDGVATTDFSHKCYRAAGHAHSLHSCLDLCGPGASPVCPGSELETEFIYTFMSEAGYSRNWLGWYRNPGGGVSCVSSNAGTLSFLYRALDVTWGAAP